MSHTPGPWRIVGDGIYAGSPDKDGKYTHDKQVLPFYDCDPKGINGIRHAADAKLIAAAPAMLMALNDCIAAYEAHRDNQPTGHLWPDPNHIMWAKLAVHQATTGEESLSRFANVSS